jgi:very-short-patch-repair endonuclease
MHICINCQKEFKSIRGLNSHMWRAHSTAGQAHNPTAGKRKGPPWNKGLSKNDDLRIAKYASAVSKTLTGRPGKAHTKESKAKLSEVMKERHRLGIAHNIGQSRWNNQPSWPEKWFMDVIKNEFNDQDYNYEYPFHRFSLDFVWLHKKKVIEIDGEQHDRFEAQKQRDLIKDDLLSKEGFKVLRIKWKDMYRDPKLWISIAKEFIDIPTGLAR